MLAETEEDKLMKRMSKAAYFIPTILGYLITAPAMLFLMAVYAQGGGRDREVVPFLMVPAMLPLAMGAIALMVFVYKIWAAIQDGRPRTTPGAALGLLFVPVFNLYWMFQVYWGWAKDYNRIARERGLVFSRAPEGLGMAICVLALFSFIPVVGIAAAALAQLLLLVFMNSAINCVNALSEAHSAAPSKPAAYVPAQAF
jgi:hypothetical protein